MSNTKGQREPEIDRLGRETFINLFLAANRFSSEVEEVCSSEGLTMSHYTVLWVVCLSNEPEGVPMKVIADGVLTRSADATRLVDRLTKNGLIERRHSEEDRRVVLIRPTRSGRAAFKRITTAVKELHRNQWASLSSGDLRDLRGLLIKTLWGDAPASDRHPLETLSPTEARGPK
jgi:DNA-binding MarR family transcriptional regulator